MMESTTENASKTVTADLPENTNTDEQSSKEVVSVEESVKVTKEVVKPAEEVENADEKEEVVDKKITEKIVDTTDGGQTKTITVTTVKKVTPGTAETVVTTTCVTEEKATPATTTIITTTPPTPTTEEVVTKTSETVEAPIKTVAPDNNDENNEQNEETQEVEEEVEEVEEEIEEEEEEEDDEEEENVSEVKHEGFKHEELKTVVEKPNESNEKPIQQKNQVQPEAELQPPNKEHNKEQAVPETQSIAPPSIQNENVESKKQDNLNNTIKDIISSIDCNIKAEENIAALKAQELEMIKKQQELAKEIEQQRLLSQKLADENKLKQQQNNNFSQQKTIIPPKAYQPTTNVSKYSTYEESQDENIFSRKSETFETRESTNVSKKIDLHKIFTPATDTEEILPKTHYHQYQQQPRPSTSPSILPAYTDAAKHRVQLNLHQEQLLEKYTKPCLKVVQTPWEAALNSGSASAAFVEEQKLSPYPTSTLTPSPTPQLYDASQGGVPLQSTQTINDGYRKPHPTMDYPKYPSHQAPVQHVQHENQRNSASNPQRELAYKPSIPQGWKAPSMSLPKDLYMPREIPLQSYAPPPVASIPSSAPAFASNGAYQPSQSISPYKPLSNSPVTPYSMPESVPVITQPYGVGNSTFPINNNSKPYSQGFSTVYGNSQPPKQQYLPPQSYQTMPNNTHNIPQVSFNPSPLSFDKLAKFENASNDDNRYINSPPSRGSYLNVKGYNKVRNISPSPFGESYNNGPYTPPTSDVRHYGNAPSHSPQTLSSVPQYSDHNTHNVPHHPTVTSRQILNSPSYNNSARGWGSNTGRPSNIKPQIASGSNMSYTDF